MSRVGKMPVTVPQGVDVSINNTQISVKGTGGTLSIAANALVKVVNEAGQVTFTPRAGFTGKATIPYIIKDSLGMMANANLIITVEDTAVVVVPVVEKKPILAKTGGTRPDLLLLLGILALVGAGGLRFASRKS
jgi:LPXTG-motif cell wall-anchored protein